MLITETYKKRLQELAGIMSESKKSEEQGLSILAKSDVPNPEGIISDFARLDISKNQKNVPIMAFFYGKGSQDTNAIARVVNEYSELEEKKRIKPAQFTRDSIKIGDSEFREFLRFAEHVHGVMSAKSSSKGQGVAADFKSEKKPMWSGNNIDIFEGNSVSKCIAYSQGALTGKAYSFCIGQPGSGMYKSYRDTKQSSFYFIVDRNRFKENEDGSVNLDDPLHIVVFDRTDRGIELTDANNTTGSISEFGSDPNGYVDYLKSKGVPVEELVNIPKSEQEAYEDKLLSSSNGSLEWFKNLDNPYSPDYRKPKLQPGDSDQNYYKSAYIGRGHVLTNDQFDYLMGEK